MKQISDGAVSIKDKEVVKNDVVIGSHLNDNWTAEYLKLNELPHSKWADGFDTVAVNDCHSQVNSNDVVVCRYSQCSLMTWLHMKTTHDTGIL